MEVRFYQYVYTRGRHAPPPFSSSYSFSLIFFFLWHFCTPSLPVFLPNFSSPEFSSREDTASVLSLFLSFFFLPVYEPCGVRC